MEVTKFCKICLVHGVRMFSTQGYLDEYLKELLGHRILYSADLPPFVCYECASLLEKCIKFKEKCLHGQRVLFEILEDKNEITKDDILSVDRIKINLVSSLTVGPMTKDHYFAFNQDEIYSDEMDDTFDSENEPLQTLNKQKENGQLLDHDFQEEVCALSKDEETHNKCTICKKILSDSNMCVLKKHEIKQIKNISLLLKDELFSLVSSANDIKVHTKCKKKYITTGKNSKYDNRKPVLSKSKTDAVNSKKIAEKIKINNSTTEAANGTVEMEHMDCEYVGEKNKETLHEQERNDDRMKYCVICHEQLLDETYLVKSQQLETFKKFSLLREDGLYNYFHSVNEVHVHDNCQEAYTTEGDNKYLKNIFSDGNCLSFKDCLNIKHQKCVICRGTRKDVFNHLKMVSIERLKKSSLLRNDGLFHYFNSINEISIHDICEVNYNRINPKCLGPLKLISQSCKPDPNSAPRNRIGKQRKSIRRIVYGPKKEFSSRGRVDYERECFLCTRSLSTRREINTVTDPDSKEKIIKQLQKINSSPEYSDYKNVNMTIERISKLDVVGIGAQCHADCYNDILNPRPNKQAVKPYINKAMNTIFKYIEEVGEDSEFTLSELTSILKKSDLKPNNTTIKTHLSKRYKDRITLIRVRHDTVIVFND